MRGEILHYDVSQGIGFISADDGTRYMFSRNDLMQSQRVGKGLKVDFRPDGQNAREVYIADPRGPVPSQAGRAGATSVPSVGQSPAQSVAPGSNQAGQPWAPPAAPYPSMTGGAPDLGVWGYFRYCVTSGYANFRDRARRKEYWSFILFYMIAMMAISFVGMVIDGVIGNMDDGGVPFVTMVVMGLAVLFFMVPAISVTVRRFHDVGLSGWLYLLFVVLSFVYIGGIIIFVITLIASQKHDNKWGPVPSGIRM